jgi:Domain of Unknown Function (DUF1080)
MADAEGFRPIFDGKTLAGWRAVPRHNAPRAVGDPWPSRDTDEWRRADAHTGKWTVEESAIVGRQDPPGSGLGAYLVSDDTFGDFELAFEAKPDWPADTGIMVRATDIGSTGFQILLDHRRSGNIGGFYGNGIGRFHAIRFNVDAVYDANRNPVGLTIEDPATTLEPITPDKPALLARGASGEEFLAAWKWGEWNEFRITIAGARPRITTRINGVLIAELDAATMQHPHYDAAKVAALLGTRGHIAFEVHDNDPRMGEARWGRNAACRWRNVKVREL